MATPPASDKYAIELQPVARLESYEVNVLVGLHPNAAQFLAEIPPVRTRELSLRASAEPEGFAWRDDRGKRWLPGEIIDQALETLSELIVDDLRARAGR